MHLEQGQKAQAMAALEEAIQINPFDPRPHQVLIGLYGDAGRQEERAREERVLKLIGQWLEW
jgi:Tfp pilus assembly protein PilF